MWGLITRLDLILRATYNKHIALIKVLEAKK